MEWINLPCIFNLNKTLDGKFRVSVISYFRKWKETDGEKTDEGSTAMFITGRKTPMRIVLSLDKVLELLPQGVFYPFILASREVVLINTDNVWYYRDFIEEGKQQKYMLYMKPTGEVDSFHIVKTNPQEISSASQ